MQIGYAIRKYILELAIQYAIWSCYMKMHFANAIAIVNAISITWIQNLISTFVFCSLLHLHVTTLFWRQNLNSNELPIGKCILI